MIFDVDEIDRHARHLALREIGGPGQQRLKAATAVLVRMGGPSAPAPSTSQRPESRASCLSTKACRAGDMRMATTDGVSPPRGV